MSDEPEEFGKLTVTVGKTKKEETVYTLAVDRLAAAQDGLCYLLGVVGTQGTVKALRSALVPTVGATFRLEGIAIEVEGVERYARGFKVAEGHSFDCKVAQIGFGWVHALFLARTPGFLRTVSDESVYTELKRPEYTTPLLRGWAGPIRATLAAKGLLTRLHCYRCDCGLIAATTEQLDEIVEAGVRDGSLPFRELALTGA